MNSKNLITIICIMLFTFTNCFAQPSVNAERINTLCDSIEKDFRAGVVTKIPLRGLGLLLLKEEIPLQADCAMGMDSWRGYSFTDYLQCAYAPESQPFEDIAAPAPTVTRQTVEEGTLLRIGEGYLKWEEATSFHGDKFMTPDNMTEAIYYFLNNTLIKIRIRDGCTSYNFDPSHYWTNIVTAETVFPNKEASETRYFWNNEPHNDENRIKYWEENVLRKNINATPERAYQLLEQIERK